jgi:hypothetical protein
MITRITQCHALPVPRASCLNARAFASRLTPHASRILIALCLLLGFSGCTVVRLSINDPLRAEDVVFIVPGETQFSKVVAHLGVPDSLTASEQGLVAKYYFLDAKYSRINFGRIARFWSPVDPDLIFAAGGLGLDMFQVQFDASGTALASSFAYHTGTPGFIPWPFRGASLFSRP